MNTINKQNGELPAFACVSERYRQAGLTKREYFASEALQGLLSIFNDTEQITIEPNEDNVKYMAKLAVKAADALLDALS